MIALQRMLPELAAGAVERPQPLRRSRPVPAPFEQYLVEARSEPPTAPVTALPEVRQQSQGRADG